MRMGPAEARLGAALYLVSEEDDETACLFLRNRLRDNPSAELAEEIFDAFEDSSHHPDLTRSDYESLIASNADLRHEALHYLAHDGEAYEWLDLDAALSWEPYVLGSVQPEAGHGGIQADENGEQGCDDDCEALAELVTEHFFSAFDWGHFDAHLRSGDATSVEYAMLVVEESETPVLVDTLIELVADPEHGEYATEILTDWAEMAADAETENMLEQIDEELSPARAKKLQAYFRDRLVEEETR